MKNNDIEREINLRKEKVNEFINMKLFYKKIRPNYFDDACKNLFLAGGKRIRTSVSTLSCELSGGKLEWALPPAAAMECIHAYSLIHDDLIDHGTRRRGQPSINIKYGEPIAILAGDVVLTKAYESISYSKDYSDISDKQITQLMETVTELSLDLCEGQALDIHYSTPEMIQEINEDECIEMLSKKTGSLVAGAAKSGGIVAGLADEQLYNLWEFGRCFGTCFQIIDDVLDVIAKKEAFGKPLGGDIKESKCTLMSIYALNQLEGDNRSKFIKTLGNPKATQDEIDSCIQILRDTGAIKYALMQAESILDHGKKQLEKFEDSNYKRLLFSLNPQLALKLAGVNYESLTPTQAEAKYW